MDNSNRSPVKTNSLFVIKDNVKLFSLGVSKAGITNSSYEYKVGKHPLLSKLI